MKKIFLTALLATGLSTGGAVIAQTNHYTAPSTTSVGNIPSANHAQTSSFGGSASGSYGVTQGSGTWGGDAGVSTSGGSESSTGATGNSNSKNSTTNYGGGTSSVYSGLNGINGVSSGVNTTSYSGGKSVSHQNGNGASGSTDGGTGTNVYGDAGGNYNGTYQAGSAQITWNAGQYQSH
jgi:hypothetical protein